MGNRCLEAADQIDTASALERSRDQNDVSLRLGQVNECLPRTELTSDNFGGGREDEQRFEQTAKCAVILDNGHFDLHGVPFHHSVAGESSLLVALVTIMPKVRLGKIGC